ncbi:AMP-binding protein [Phenylobacterium sp.]|jgi:acyl-CoA synthetase (AMP-forming)/AMP-acid ligase II|uniref:AMP-binding protein n=1 Tax=Phenylobacterium sp. TaxID=1871053 RepID=UPI002F91C884
MTVRNPADLRPNGEMQTALANALAQFADLPALVLESGRSVSYGELAKEAGAIGAHLPDRKALVVIEGGNNPATVAAYVGALLKGHAVHLLEPDKPGALASIRERFGLDAHIRCSSEGWHVQTSLHEPPKVHDAIAILFSTSGTTGASKLVKITQRNILSNTQSIVRYLGIENIDRAITVLKPHYSYGLSVLNSHLLSGASLLLTDRSVQDPWFWSLASEWQITNFAGVPHTFETLARGGTSLQTLPSLRFVTQAGGKLHPELVRKFAAAGERSGWRFYVMYGQTEASPRMAYLPPEMALSDPDAIGVPVPGGRLEIVDEEGRSIEEPFRRGELVYYGPNVMAGYASSREDLADAAHVERLATGDLAFRRPNGLFVLAGRKSRFVKPLGIRVSLDEVEQVLIGEGFAVAAVSAGEAVAIFHEGAPPLTHARASELLNLPKPLIHIHISHELPRLPSGKVDYAALQSLALSPARVSLCAHPLRFVAEVAREAVAIMVGSVDRSRSITSVFREVMRLTSVDLADTFVSLGGDSLTYVGLTIALEELVGPLPANWHLMTINELEALRGARE